MSPGSANGADTIGAMSTRLWDRAALVPASDGERRPEVVALDSVVPSLSELFTFMRDAELRWTTLPHHAHAPVGSGHEMIGFLLR